MELVLIVVVLFAAGSLGVLLHNRRADRLVREWAESRGVAIVRRNRTWSRLGPGTPLDTNQVLRYLTVRDASGAERKVWLLLGSDDLGLIDNSVDEIWE